MLEKSDGRKRKGRQTASPKKLSKFPRMYKCALDHVALAAQRQKIFGRCAAVSTGMSMRWESNPLGARAGFCCNLSAALTRRREG